MVRLRTKLFGTFALLVAVFGVLSALMGIRIINSRVMGEAQTRIHYDLSSAWSIYNHRLREIEIILKLVSGKESIVSLCDSEDWADSEIIARLERIRLTFGLDFLAVADPEGKVVIRTGSSSVRGDYKSSDPAVTAALKGEPMVCMTSLSAEELKRESDGLAERAFLEIENTPHSRQTSKQSETRGMVMVGAVPVRQGMRILGVVYGGILISRNNELVDHIRDVVFKNEAYDGKPVGSATIFLDDTRIATTVRLKNGNRALGTRASKKVADAVLDNAQPWVGKATVVDEECLTAYEAIRDGRGSVIGMLYVGIPMKRFEDLRRGVMFEYMVVSLFVLTLALALAYVMASRLAQPIHRLVEASRSMSNGEHPAPVPHDQACYETSKLVNSFNEMAATLAEREEKLRALNRSYMDLLGFVSHELKSPVASLMNYVYLLREKKIGPLTDKQCNAVQALDRGCNRLLEMVRHYLNLSRIESGGLKPVPTRVSIADDVLTPLLDAMEATISAARMLLENGIGPDVSVTGDLNMVREIFENLVSNSVKYGREAGRIALKARPAGDFVEFSVWNEGAGIPEDKLGLMFQKFQRFNGDGRGSGLRGTGLGLFITKSLVEAHGGTIRVASKAGEWIEFTFTLPAQKETAEAKGDVHE